MSPTCPTTSERMIARRIQNGQAPVIPIVGQWTREHAGTMSLGQGIVHYAPPPEVSAAVVEAAADDPGLNRYADVAGRDGLIQLIATKLACDNRIDVTGQDATIVCTAGANMGFIN